MNIIALDIVAIYPKQYSRVLTDNYYLDILDCGQKIFSGPLVASAGGGGGGGRGCGGGGEGGEGNLLTLPSG